MKKIVLAYSGGLDTSCAVRWLKDTYEAEVVCFSAFIGEVGESWKIIDPIVKTWQSGNPPLFTYKTGSWGPKEADKFIEQDGRKWLAPYLTICNI